MIALMLLFALQDSPPIMIVGEGSVSCATAWRRENVEVSEEWVAGFWSGLNLDAKAITGHTTDRDGIIGEVRLVCQRQPSANLLQATVTVYAAMRASSR